MKLIGYLLATAILLLLFNSCISIRYDTKGGSTIDPKIETVSVQYFDNRATRINPNLSQNFTNELKTYMEKNTTLRTVNTIGDVDFSGQITTYSIASTAIAANDEAAKTRFTITVRVKFTNSVNPDQNFDTSFSRYRDFSSTISFASVENQLTEEIITELIEQVYNKAFVNW